MRCLAERAPRHLPGAASTAPSHRVSLQCPQTLASATDTLPAAGTPAPPGHSVLSLAPACPGRCRHTDTASDSPASASGSFHGHQVAQAQPPGSHRALRGLSLRLRHSVDTAWTQRGSSFKQQASAKGSSLKEAQTTGFRGHLAMDGATCERRVPTAFQPWEPREPLEPQEPRALGCLSSAAWGFL